jgi:hypothetical protein
VVLHIALIHYVIPNIPDSDAVLISEEILSSFEGEVKTYFDLTLLLMDCEV